MLAAAILLKIKSSKLVGEDLEHFDKLLAPEEELEEGLLDEGLSEQQKEELGKVDLIPRTPQPRKRKVSVYDLMNALDKALEVKRRRVLQSIPPPLIPPAKTKDMTQLIKTLYLRIKNTLFKSRKNRVMFSQLVPSQEKDDKIYTFIPLLHLTTQRKVELFQQRHFEDFEVYLKSKKEVDKELSGDVS